MEQGRGFEGSPCIKRLTAYTDGAGAAHAERPALFLLFALAFPINECRHLPGPVSIPEQWKVQNQC